MTDEDIARLCASEVACYRWPEDTAEHRAMRAAFIDGAVHTVAQTPSVNDVLRRVADLPHFKNHQVEMLVRDARDLLATMTTPAEDVT